MDEYIITKKPISKPINISHNFGSSDNNNKFQFELYIYGKNIRQKYFKKIENKNYSDLIKFSDNILLSDIDNYKIKLSVLNYNNVIEEYTIEDTINHNLLNNTHNNGTLYIEFTQNNNGYVLCNYIYFKLNRMFITPPN